MKTFLGALGGALAVGAVLFSYNLGERQATAAMTPAPTTQMLVGPDGIARPYLISSQGPSAPGAMATLPGYSPYATATPLAGPSYVATQPQYVSERVVTQRPVVRRVSTTRQSSYEPDVPRRSWQKSALLIGGSAAGGAGLGGLIGGKKGALAGAALGGGAAAIYDQVKRR
jgi:uncharacterized protein YcfJ